MLVDEEDRRYFKQQVWNKKKWKKFSYLLLKEITLWRKAELNENRVPTNQFISSQLPNGNFKVQSVKENSAKSNQSKPPLEEPDAAPEAAFWHAHFHAVTFFTTSKTWRDKFPFDFSSVFERALFRTNAFRTNTRLTDLQRLGYVQLSSYSHVLILHSNLHIFMASLKRQKLFSVSTIIIIQLR